MSHIFQSIRMGPRDEPPRSYSDVTHRFRRKDNAEFLAYVATEHARSYAVPPRKGGPAIDPSAKLSIVLLGAYGLLSYRVRRAQEMLRADGTPSHWSHAFLLPHGLPGTAAAIRGPASPWVWESPLEPSSDSRELVRRSGTAVRRLSEYVPSEHRWFGFQGAPNIAVMSIGLTPAERDRVEARANLPDADQAAWDFPSLLSRWSSFVRRRDGEGNPLSEGIAFPAAAYVQYAYDAAGLDLAPGGSQRNTAPEHFWQAGKYLVDLLAVADPETGKLVPRPIAVWACLRDRACVVYPAWYRTRHRLPRRMSEIEAKIEGRPVVAKKRRRRAT